MMVKGSGTPVRGVVLRTGGSPYQAGTVAGGASNGKSNGCGPPVVVGEAVFLSEMGLHMFGIDTALTYE